MPKIGVRNAIQLAKAFVQDTFADEGITNVGLEEIRFDSDANDWLITIGFTRPWDIGRTILPLEGPQKRTYKVVTIHDGTGEPTSITQRDVAA